MSELIAVTYQTEQRARDVMSTLQRMQLAHLVDLADACYVTRDARGRIELHQSINVTTRGAVRGAFWGALVGVVFQDPLVGLVGGAASDALAGKLAGVGICDDFMRELAVNMDTGRSVLFVLVRRATTDQFIDELSRHGGRIIHAPLSRDAEDRLRQALSSRTEESFAAATALSAGGTS